MAYHIAWEKLRVEITKSVAHRWRVAIVSLLLPSAAFAQATPSPPAATTATATTPAPTATDPPNFALPYHALACHGGPLLALSIDGATNQWFLADTGISSTWLSLGSPERLHLKPVPYVVNGVAQTDGTGKAIASANLKLGIGPLTFPLDALVDTGWLQKIYGDIDAAEKLEGGSRLLGGIVGTNILRYYAVELDPSQQEMRLSSGDLTDSYLTRLGFSGGLASGIPITVDPASGLPTISVTIDDGTTSASADKSAPARSMPMILDTGTFQTCVPASFAGQFKTPSLVRLADAAAPGGGLIDIHPETTIHIGSASLSHFTTGVSVTESSAANGKLGILGMDFLAHFRVLIDFPKQRLYLEPLASVALYDNPSLRENATRFIDGHLLQPSASGDWYLRAAPPESIFTKVGLLPTDRIVAVDGVALSGKPSLEVAVLLYKAQTMDIARSGRKFRLTLGAPPAK